MHRNNRLPEPPHYSPIPLMVYPDSLNPVTAWVLAYLLINNPEQPFFDALDLDTGLLVKYEVPLPDPSDPSQTKMQQMYLMRGLTKFISNKYPNEAHYAVCASHPIASGYEGKVFLSDETIKLTENNAGCVEVDYKKKADIAAKKRVVKRLLKPKTGDERTQNGKAQREWRFVHLLTPNNIKAPILTPDDSSAALVMRYIPGKTLAHYLQHDRYGHLKHGIFKPFRFSLLQRFILTIRLGKALIHLHENNIIHRDFKPLNTLVNTKTYLPDIEIIDFGLAKFKGEILPDHDRVGTEGFAAPEMILEGCATDEKSDGYAFAVTLNEYLWCDIDDGRYDKLDVIQMTRLRAAIRRGMDDDQEKRASIQNILEVFAEVCNEYTASCKQTLAARSLKK